MSRFYDDLMEGFTEILDAQASGRKLKSRTLEIPEVKHYTNADIKRIRNKTGMTQKLFAIYMGVSKKTVEAWERGVNKPTGPACRLLSIIESNDSNGLNTIFVP